MEKGIEMKRVHYFVITVDTDIQHMIKTKTDYYEDMSTVSSEPMQFLSKDPGWYYAKHKDRGWGVYKVGDALDGYGHTMAEAIGTDELLSTYDFSVSIKLPIDEMGRELND